MQSKTPIVLAFDPGYERLGVAVVSRVDGRDTLLFSDCLRTSASHPFTERLGELITEVEQLIETHHPTDVALETLFFNTNQKTAMRVAEVRGALLALALKAGLSVHEYAPSSVKVAITGSGASDKRQVTTMVTRLVALDDSQRVDDEYDAIAVGLTCLAHHRG